MYNREQLVRRLRAEGRAAAILGKHPQTNPYQPWGGPNWHQWMRGYNEITARGPR